MQNMTVNTGMAVWGLPELVETSQEGKVIVLGNPQVQTDRTIPNNKPDSIICDNEKGTCVLIDGAI